MKKYTFTIPGTTSAVKHYLPIPDAGKLVGLYAVVNSAQTAGTATVQAGKAGAATSVLTANLGTTGANGIGKVAKGALTPSVTEANKQQIFDGETPIELTAVLVVAGSIGVTVLVDEYAIGAKAL
jgi:hypothetical protein